MSGYFQEMYRAVFGRTGWRSLGFASVYECMNGMNFCHIQEITVY